MCSARPVQVKVCSGTYIGKLKASVSKMLEGMQLLGGANVGLSMDLQEQVSDAKDQMQAMRAKLDGFVDAVGNEMRQVMQEHRNVQSQEVAEVVREVMIGVLGRGNSFEREEVERQLMQLAEEQDKVRREKTFNREMEEELLRAVCAISLMQPENAANGAGGSAAACAPPQSPPITLFARLAWTSCRILLLSFKAASPMRERSSRSMRFNPCRDPATNQEWSEPLTLAPNVLVRKMIREWQEQAPPPASQSSSRQIEPSSPPRSAARSDQIEQLNTRMRIEQSRGETPDTVESRRVIAAIDTDGSGTITYDEFARHLASRGSSEMVAPRGSSLSGEEGTVRDISDPAPQYVGSQIEERVAAIRNGRADAATALADMKTDAGRKAIIAANGIPPLIQMITDGPPASKTEAARALMSIMAIGEGQVAVARAGGIAPLVELATTGTVAAKEQAAGALRNLSITADNRVPLVQAGCVDPLVELSKTGTNSAKEHTAAALWAICVGLPEHRVIVASAGGIEPLVTLARSGSNNVIKENAAGALWRISIENSANQQEIARLGGIEAMVALAKGLIRKGECDWMHAQPVGKRRRAEGARRGGRNRSGHRTLHGWHGGTS